MGVLDRAACPTEPESRAFTNGALAELRAGDWLPAGWARFLGQVTVRSCEQIVAHARPAAEISVLHGLFLVAGRGKGRWWITTSWLAAITHLGLLGERRTIGLANTISLTRANLVATGEPLGRWLGVVAAASDKLDGMLARRQGPTMFGFYADSLADAAFWTWLGTRRDPSRLILAASVTAWAAPVIAVTAASIAKGEMVESPRPALLRPAAAMQVVLAVRAVLTPHACPGVTENPTRQRNSSLSCRVPGPRPRPDKPPAPTVRPLSGPPNQEGTTA